MQKILLFFLGIVVHSFILSQAPQRFSFQAVIRNENQQLIVSSSIGVKILIHQNASNGNVVYEELFNPNPITNENGLLTIEVGGGIPLAGSFSEINWGLGSYYLEVLIDPSGQTNYTLSAANQLLSVPYALHAANAGGGDLPEGNQEGDILYWNGASWTTLPFGQPYQQLTNCNGQLRWAPYAPDVETLPTPSNINPTAATLGIQVIDNGCSHANATVLVSLNPTATETDGTIGVYSIQSTPLNPGNYFFDVYNLIPGQTYYYRAYMNTGIGFDYGQIHSFQTIDYAPIELTIDTVNVYRTPFNQIDEWDSLPHFNFYGHLVGRVINIGESTNAQTGYCWGYEPNPDFDDHVIPSQTVFSNLSYFYSNPNWGSDEQNLMRPNSDVYFRAYAINQALDTSFSTNSIMVHTEGSEGNVGPSGGIIVLDKLEYSNGWRYLEAAPTDASGGAPWGCANSELNNQLGSILGTGSDNTSLITASCLGNTHAAAICANYSLSGFTDWFLPSRHEGIAMLNTFNQLDFVPDIIGSYWSSSPEEFTGSILNPSCIDFSYSNMVNFCPQTDLLKVRPMRRY
jgi:hypothetical protein